MDEYEIEESSSDGLSHAIISFVGRRLRNPTLDTLLRVGRVPEVDLSKLIGEPERNASRQRRK